MSFATQAGAGQVITTVSALVSDSQIKLAQQKFNGQLDGVALAAKYEFSPDWYLKYDLLIGSGSLNGTTKNYSFNQNMLYAYQAFSADNSFYFDWKLTYKIGAGVYHKVSKLDTENYHQSQFPVLLGIELENPSGVKISLAGFGQLNNLSNNRSGNLSFTAPLTGNVNVIGKYSNHSSKVVGLQHCGSDYFVGISLRF